MEIGDRLELVGDKKAGYCFGCNFDEKNNIANKGVENEHRQI